MIEILNVKGGDIYYQSVIQIFGNCSTTNCNELIEVTNGDGPTIAWKIISSYFKAFVKLNHGKNEICIRSTICQVKLVVYRLSHKITKSFKLDTQGNRGIRVLYVVCEDDLLNGEFQSDNLNGNNKLENALKRVDLGVKLLQTYISEVMYKKFCMRKTFMLRNDLEELEDENACEVFYTSLSKKRALEMEANQLFIHLAEELKAKKIYQSNSKYIAVLSFTQYSHSEDTDIFKNTKGYCALGAEWLAVYGTPCLYSWAESLETLEKCFTDDTLIDKNRLMNDSAYRNVYWACYSTTLGSLLHEFSHILDVGHNLSGIMARGFDDLYRFFTVNSKICFCFSKHSNIKTNNLFIDRITTVSNEIENREGNLKQTRVKKIAIFKSEFIDKLSFISGFTKEIVFSLKCDQNISSKTSLEKNLFDLPQNCRCMKTCIYLECNLFMLFYNKWLNNFIDSSESACSNIFRAATSKMNETLNVVLTSKNALAFYEFRTLKRSLTFEHKVLVDLEIKTLKINCTSTRNELKKFLFDLNKDQLYNEEKLVDSFEIVVLDVYGNIFKKIVNF